MSDISTLNTTNTQLVIVKKHLAESQKWIAHYQFKDALTCLEKALAVCQALELQNDDPTLARVYAGMGKSYLWDDCSEQALYYHRKALDIRLQLLEEGHLELLESYHGVGSAWMNKGNLEVAMSYFRKVFHTIEKTLDDLPDFTPELYRNMGGFYRDFNNDLRQALAYFQKSLNISIEIFGVGHYDNALSYNVLGSCYLSMGKLALSKEYFQKGIDIQLRGIQHPPYITVLLYNGMGVAYTHHPDGIFAPHPKLEFAIGYFEKALAIEHTYEASLKKVRLHSYINIGHCYGIQKDYKRAKQYMLQALDVGLHYPNMPDHEMILCYFRLASLYFNNNQFKKSLVYSQKCLQIGVKNYKNDDVYDNPPLKKYSYGRLLSDILRNKAAAFYFHYKRISKASKDIEAALVASELTIQLIEQIRQSHRADTSKLVWSQRMNQAYIFGIMIAYTVWKNNPLKKIFFLEKCFWFAEKAKANLLLSTMQDSIAKAQAMLPLEVLEKERVLKKELNQIEKNIQQTESTPAFSEEEKKAKAKAIREMEMDFLAYNQHYQQFIKQLEQDYPDYHQLKYQYQTVSIVQAQALLKKEEVLIQYAIGLQSYFIFAISTDQIWLYNMAKSKQLAETINAFQRNMFLRNIQEYMRLSKQLYEQLLAPIETALKDKHKLFIIPDGELHRLSFDALLEPIDKPILEFSKLPYLIKRFDIQYHYSATLLHYAHQKKQRQKANVVKDGFLGLAPIRFGERATASNGYILKSGKKGRQLILKSGGDEQAALMDLEDTETEVKTVYELFEKKEKEAIALFYDMASKDNLLEHIEKYKHILLSTHGFADTEHDNLSGINLYSEKGEDTEASKLYISDVMNLNLNADLVVLSSCESGVGKLQTGEGMMALHRAFLFAGADNIIYSLFKVPQDATSELTQTLFRHILEGDNYSTALRKAKIALINDEAMEPVDWAGFALIGG